MFIAFREGGRKGRIGGGGRGERVRETHSLAASPCAPTGLNPQNKIMCPDRESNLQPFGIWDNALTS